MSRDWPRAGFGRSYGLLWFAAGNVCCLQSWDLLVLDSVTLLARILLVLHKCHYGQGLWRRKRRGPRMLSCCSISMNGSVGAYLPFLWSVYRGFKSCGLEVLRVGVVSGFWDNLYTIWQTNSKDSAKQIKASHIWMYCYCVPNVNSIVTEQRSRPHYHRIWKKALALYSRALTPIFMDTSS